MNESLQSSLGPRVSFHFITAVKVHRHKTAKMMQMCGCSGVRKKNSQSTWLNGHLNSVLQQMLRAKVREMQAARSARAVKHVMYVSVRRGEGVLCLGKRKLTKNAKRTERKIGKKKTFHTLQKAVECS